MKREKGVSPSLLHAGRVLLVAGSVVLFILLLGALGVLSSLWVRISSWSWGIAAFLIAAYLIMDPEEERSPIKLNVAGLIAPVVVLAIMLIFAVKVIWWLLNLIAEMLEPFTTPRE